MTTFRTLASMAFIALLAQEALAVPPGYRYVGGRVVSGGRHVNWYWNADYFRLTPDGAGFVAQMWARNVELEEERSFDAVVRCDAGTYARLGSGEESAVIEAGDPIDEVRRAGCSENRAANKAIRLARLNGADAPRPAAPSPRPSAPAMVRAAGERTGLRVDRCIRFANAEPSMFGDATVTNTCGFDVQVVFCYKGGQRRHFDCPQPPIGMGADSIAPGRTHRLPEYRAGTNRGIVFVACNGAIGTIVPLLNDNGGKTGCY